VLEGCGCPSPSVAEKLLRAAEKRVRAMNIVHESNHAVVVIEPVIKSVSVSHGCGMDSDYLRW
jgi:hypothetical protein